MRVFWIVLSVSGRVDDCGILYLRKRSLLTVTEASLQWGAVKVN